MFYAEIKKQQDRLHINKLIKDSLQQQIHFNGNVYGHCISIACYQSHLCYMSYISLQGQTKR